MKSFATPPVLVKEVAKAVMCMLKEKEDWKTAQIQMNQPDKFKQRLVILSEDISKVQKKTWNKVRKIYLVNPDFTEEKVEKASSAAATLLVWLQAADQFEKVKKLIKPLEHALKEANAKLEIC